MVATFLVFLGNFTFNHLLIVTMTNTSMQATVNNVIYQHHETAKMDYWLQLLGIVSFFAVKILIRSLEIS